MKVGALYSFYWLQLQVIVVSNKALSSNIQLTPIQQPQANFCLILLAGPILTMEPEAEVA